MGNTANTGHVVSLVAHDNALGFEKSMQLIMANLNIKPWPAKELLRGSFQRQSELSARSPLRLIPVQDAFAHYSKHCGGWINRLTRNKFVQLAVDLLDHTGNKSTPKEREELYDMFDAIDVDGTADLSIGELAGGLHVYFKGSLVQRMDAVYSLLDSEGTGQLSKDVLHEYLKPYVWTMVPKEADVLRPLLLKKVTDDLFAEMTYRKTNHVARDEMQEFMRRGGPNAVVDKAAAIIDRSVYTSWLEEQDRRRLQQYSQQSYEARFGRPPLVQHVTNQSASLAQHVTNQSAAMAQATYQAVGQHAPIAWQKLVNYMTPEQAMARASTVSHRRSSAGSVASVGSEAEANSAGNSVSVPQPRSASAGPRLSVTRTSVRGGILRGSVVQLDDGTSYALPAPPGTNRPNVVQFADQPPAKPQGQNTALQSRGRSPARTPMPPIPADVPGPLPAQAFGMSEPPFAGRFMPQATPKPPTASASSLCPPSMPCAWQQQPQQLLPQQQPLLPPPWNPQAVLPSPMLAAPQPLVVPPMAWPPGLSVSAPMTALSCR